MRAKEFLHESSGIFNRKRGDEFINNSTGRILNFVGITKYPDIGQYASIEERDIAKADVSTGKVIEWVNPRQEKSDQYLAFAVAELVDSAGNKYYWGRYFKEMLSIMTKSWPPTDVPPGWKLNTKAAAKMTAGFDPQKLINTEQQFNSVDDAANFVISKLGKTHTLSKGLEDLLNGKLPTFNGMGNQMPAIRDYFGEIMAPIALAKNLVGGQAAAAQKQLLGSYSWAQCKVKWYMSPSHNLSDSSMFSPDGIEVEISSKGGRGASSSVKNIYDIYLKYKTKNPQLLAQYPKELGYLEAIHSNSQFYGPLEIAIDVGILKPRTERTVDDPISSGQEIADDLWNLIKNPNLPIPPDLSPFLGSKNAITAASNYNPGHHILSSIATQVAAYLNTQTRLNDLMKLILNDSSIVQVYTKMIVKGNDAVVTGFDAIFPAKYTGNLKISADKGYSASGTSPGKFTFDFN